MTEFIAPPTAPSPRPQRTEQVVEHVTFQYAFMVAGFSGGADTAAKALRKATGKVLPAMGVFSAIKGGHVFALAPATWFVVTDDEALAGKILTLDGAIVAVTNLANARVYATVEGADAAFKLSKGTLLDFSDDTFPVNTVKQTAIHHIPVMIARTSEDKFMLVVMRTFSDTFMEWLEAK